jgi:hypothetical protein
MLHKDIKWANKELPGLTEEELNEVSFSKLVASELAKELGQKNKETGHWEKIRWIGAEKGRETQKASGHWDKVKQLGGVASTSKFNQCPHCQLPGTGPSIDRHRVRCLQNPAFIQELQSIIDQLPEEFNRKNVIDICGIRTFHKIEESGIIEKTGKFKDRFPIYTKKPA